MRGAAPWAIPDRPGHERGHAARHRGARQCGPATVELQHWLGWRQRCYSGRLIRRTSARHHSADAARGWQVPDQARGTHGKRPHPGQQDHLQPRQQVPDHCGLDLFHWQCALPGRHTGGGRKWWGSGMRAVAARRRCGCRDRRSGFHAYAGVSQRRRCRCLL